MKLLFPHSSLFVIRKAIAILFVFMLISIFSFGKSMNWPMCNLNETMTSYNSNDYSTTSTYTEFSIYKFIEDKIIMENVHSDVYTFSLLVLH